MNITLRMPFNIKFILFKKSFSIDDDIARFSRKSTVKLVHSVQLMFDRFSQDLVGSVERTRVALVRPEFRSSKLPSNFRSF